MTPQPTYGPHNPHPLSTLRTELVWEGKYDEYGQRREVDIAGCAMPMQKIESIDEPRRAAAAAGQLELFERQNPKQDDFRNRLIWGDNKLVMASLLQEFKGKVDLIYTALFKSVRYRVFVGSLAERGFQQKLWFYFSAERCKYTQVDKDGRRYQLDNMTSPNPRPNMMYKWMGYPFPEKGWRYSKQTMQRLHDEGRIWYPSDKSKRPRLKWYLDEVQESGKPLQSVWSDIYPVNSQANERLDYPTQKSEALLERIIQAFSNEDDLVADFFCGSGTTGAVAERLGRRWLMCDLGRFAIHTSRKRMIELQRKLHSGGKPYRAFDVYNLGRYERQWWQKDRLQGADDEHRRVILEFFKAEVLTNTPSPLLHGRKAGTFCHVDGIDERAIKSGFDFIDFWAIDFNWQPGKPFTHDWLDYRTRKDRSLKTISDTGYTYPAPGKYTACVKVVDTFGCDTSITVEVEV